MSADTAEAFCRSRTAERADTADGCSRRWWASLVTGWSFSGHVDCLDESTPRPTGGGYVVFVVSCRRRDDAEGGSSGEGREMWWNAGIGFLGVFATGKGIEAGSSGRPPAVGDG